MFTAAVCVAATLIAGAVVPAHVQVPFEMRRPLNAMLVQAEVNGRPATLLVDTGAAHTVISDGFVPAIDVGAARFQGGGPGLRGEAVAVEVKLRIASEMWPARRVAVMNLQRVSQMYGREIGGLLGQDLLMEFERVTIDMKRRVLVLSRQEP